MRDPVDAPRLRLVMAEIARAAERDLRVYLVGVPGRQLGGSASMYAPR